MKKGLNDLSVVGHGQLPGTLHHPDRNFLVDISGYGSYCVDLCFAACEYAGVESSAFESGEFVEE
jgi:hypothetical protein